MYIAVDDTDSRTGNCTTFLATELIREFRDLDLIGLPRLVRLNPAVPWKTRGNGSLVMRFGIGSEEPILAGEVDGQHVQYYPAIKEEVDEHDLLDRAKAIVRKRSSSDAQPGLVISRKQPRPGLYWSGVRDILDKKQITDELSRMDALVFEMNGGRGVIGATCGMAWRPRDSTYEILAYREETRWGTVREADLPSIRTMNGSFPSTFNNWEERTGKAAIVPSTPCPVLFGVRGDDPQELIAATQSLITEPCDRWMMFLTNQGTDDHIIRDYRELLPNRSYVVEGTVSNVTGRLSGGHSFMNLSTRYGELCCALYEPSKDFRGIFDLLLPGDRLQVYGELRETPRSLNVEKIKVMSLVEGSVKACNPRCPQCGMSMHSVGKGQGYRCRPCHTRTAEAIMEPVRRQIVLGWYEPPVTARRHLSKPLKRMGVEQPVDFV